ncbi:MAG: DUF4278 domain-containing protein [Leptolyngbya sp. SIO1D8]|nr:DUF4278 domain-containing protein [Leptolyngbya sp. SIO1D8]
MNFTYRGVSYQAPIAGTEAPATHQAGTFLGKSYQMKQSPAIQRQPSTELTYRGVRYIR